MTQKQRWKPAATVAAVIEANGRFLLVEEETADGLRLNNPAGHLDAGESPLEAVVREALEETTREFRPEAFLGVFMSRHKGETYLRMAFSGSVGEPVEGRVLDEGIVRTVWMTLEELRACPERHRTPLLMACIEAWLAGRRLPLEAVYAHESVRGQ
ncbi:MAG: NUDIX hydrolase [Paucibacter sp.]|nr:NUDIX hydrolase [Roseateles sp.]